MNMPTMIILGGARSGKSARALSFADAIPGARAFIATAQAFDAEMADRIARHRAERDASWTTIEEPLALAETIVNARDRYAVILVDCLTLWLSNLMLGEHDADAAEAALLDAARAASTVTLIFVSNEVGMGLVPETPLGRAFRDRQGRLNAIFNTRLQGLRKRREELLVQFLEDADPIKNIDAAIDREARALSAVRLTGAADRLTAIRILLKP